jgi:hypothetical protein
MSTRKSTAALFCDSQWPQGGLAALKRPKNAAGVTHSLRSPDDSSGQAASSSMTSLARAHAREDAPALAR